MEELVSTSYEEAAKELERFRSTLDELGAPVEPGSFLDRAILATQQLTADREALRAGGPLPPTDTRAVLRTAVGLRNFASLIESRRAHQDLPALVPHIQLLNKTAPALTTPRSGDADAGNKLLELRFALALMGCADKIDIDHPIKSAATSRPDLVADINASTSVAFECKVPNSIKPSSLLRLFKKAISQIESSRAEYGLVVMSLRNDLPHDEVYQLLHADGPDGPTYNALPNKQSAISVMESYVENRVKEMIAEVSPEAIADELRGKKALPGIGVVVDTVVLVRDEARRPNSAHLSYLHIVKTDWGVAKRLDVVPSWVASINSNLLQRPA
jgi:hypothetical protein